MGVNMSYVAMYSATIGVHARVQVLIAIVLLLQWSKNLPEIRTRFQFLDLFAGEAGPLKHVHMHVQRILLEGSSSLYEPYNLHS